MLYIEWLVLQVTDEHHPSYGYSRMFMFLAKTRFFWIHPYDQNREQDGLYLRKKYDIERVNNGDYDETPYVPSWVSLLEVLVALAIRCENEIMYDPDEEDRTAVWFWMMVNNLGIDWRDDEFDDNIANYIVKTFLNQDYYPNGEGGLFPVDNTHYDMREMDLWQQMQYYLEAFYPT